MKRETISLALSGLEERFISEAMDYCPRPMQGTPERNIHMKKKRIMSVALAAALILALGVTAFAVAGIVRSTATRAMPKTAEYADLADIPEVERDVGYPVSVVESFTNGYGFSTLRVTGEAVYGENEEVLREYYSVCVTYSKPGERDLLLTLSPIQAPEDTDEPAPTERRTVNETEIRLSLDHYKMVPEEYEKTQEDLARENEGHYYISFGPEKITEKEYGFAEFDCSGVRYVLMDDNASADSLDVLAEMAGELIAGADF